MMKLLKELSGFKPLLYHNESLILSRGSDLYLADLDLENLSKFAAISTLSRARHSRFNRLATRLMRFECGPAIALPGTNEILVWLGGQVFHVDLTTGETTAEEIKSAGRAPLMMTTLSSNVFEDGIYFGEYFSNSSKGPAKIWKRSPVGKWKVVFEFQRGEINHIHSIYYDEHDDCAYILTGDYDDAPSIWRADKNFDSVEKLISAGQMSRSCWISSEKDQLVYATDSHLSTNYLCSVEKKPASQSAPEIVRHFPTVGSSIFSMSLGDNGICFSTAVEPGEPTGNKLKDFLTTSRGPGILSNHSCIYQGSLQEGFKIIFSAPKDGWPTRLFGFGAFMFPHGTSSNNNVIHAYGSGLKNFDGTTIVLSN